MRTMTPPFSVPKSDLAAALQVNSAAEITPPHPSVSIATISDAVNVRFMAAPVSA
jgi:hypothetical protein